MAKNKPRKTKSMCTVSNPAEANTKGISDITAAIPEINLSRYTINVPIGNTSPTISVRIPMYIKISNGKAVIRVAKTPTVDIVVNDNTEISAVDKIANSEKSRE